MQRHRSRAPGDAQKAGRHQKDAEVADADDVSLTLTLTLTPDEALLLFDLLYRWEDDGQVRTPQNEAEQVALWNLSALLERVLVEPFSPDYTRLVSEARTRLTPVD